MKIINVTNAIQSIEFIDGRYLALLPFSECEFEENEVYDFELDRIKKVFMVENNVDPPVEKPKSYLKKTKIEMPDLGEEVE